MRNEMLAQRDSSPGRRTAQFCKPKIRNTVAECVQYARAGNDWIVTEVMSPDGRWRTTVRTQMLLRDSFMFPLCPSWLAFDLYTRAAPAGLRFLCPAKSNFHLTGSPSCPTFILAD